MQGEKVRVAMHVQRRAGGIQQRTWSGQLDDAPAELYCARYSQMVQPIALGMTF